MCKESNLLSLLIEEIKLQELAVEPVDNNSEIKTTNTNEAFNRINQIKNNVLKEND